MYTEQEIEEAKASAASTALNWIYGAMEKDYDTCPQCGCRVVKNVCQGNVCKEELL
jgi:hypothetical protein